MAEQKTALPAPVTLGAGAVAAVILAHFTVDLYAGYTVPLLRHFHEKFQLSQLQTSLLTIPSSLMVMFQPLLGLVSDRMRTRSFVVLGLLLATVGYGLALPLAALAGAGAAYSLALAGIWAGAVGLAAYHPQGAALAGRAKSGRFGGAVSIFVFAGSIGYGVGVIIPPIFLPHYTAWIATIGLLGLFTLIAQKSVPRLRPEDEGLSLPSPMDTLRRLAREVRPCFWLLVAFWLVAVLRATTLMAFQQFGSIYYGSDHGFSQAQGAALIAAFVLIQALAGLWGTQAAERFGLRRVLGASSLAGGLGLSAALYAANGGFPAVSCVLLILAGAVLGLSIPVNVAACQKLLPHSGALASGITLGFAWGTGGMLVPLLAGLGDILGSTWMVLAAAAALTLPCALIVFFLSKSLPAPSQTGQ